ncbi:MAG: hypothetical protein Q9187_007665, partial [Circinaria calcarea]
MEDRMTMASANLHGPTSLPHNGVPFVEALDRKRKSVELEILQFKALKEEEFRDYERKLQLAHTQDRGKPVLNPPRTDENTAPGSGSGSGSGTSGGGIGLIQGAINGNQVASPGNGFVEHQHDQLRKTNGGLSETRDKGDLDVETHQQGPRSPKPAFQRKLEFRDRFTPNYLPLLDIRPRRSPFSSSTPQEPGLPSHARATDTQLSSSATLPAISFISLNSPPRNGSLSASVPRPTVLQGRRPSSRSDMSITSLRSSLRQPKTPKSPKHVLFSIDNLVLSPSTSPVLQRKGAVPPIPFSGLFNMPKGAKQAIVTDDTDDNAPDAEDATRGISEQIEDIGVSSNLFNAGFTKPQTKGLASPGASPSSALSYHRFVEPVDLTYNTGEDDLEQVGRDDDALFSFDEDIDLEDLSDAGDKK